MQTNRAAGLTSEVRAEAARQGVTLSTLSARSGIPMTGLSRRLKGRTAFTLSEIDIVCDALGVSILELARRAEANAEVAS